MSSRDSTNLHLTGKLNGCHQRHKTLFFNPLGLIHDGFGTFSVAVQKPGDLILTDTEGSHYGYNSGNNLAIAINWATQDWLYHSLSRHIHPHSHDIVYGCQCFGAPVGIPLDIWSSNSPSARRFKYLYFLQRKTKLSGKEFGTAETIWCFYIFLAVQYLHHLGYQIPWLDEKKKVKGGEEGLKM